jgi:hypothetical protein
MAQFIEEFVCNTCLQTGHATWEGEAQTQRMIVEMSDGFDFRPNEEKPGALIIVCGQCGATQPEQLSPANSPH